MNRTYRSTIELKGSTLEYDDIVIFSFRQGPPVSYKVSEYGLIPLERGTPASKVFSVLDLSPKMTAAECYGYQPVDYVKSEGYSGYGSWPACTRRDYRAITRLIFYIFSHAENDFLRGDNWTMSHNERRRLEMTGAKLAPRPSVQFIQYKDNKITCQNTMVNFEGKKYSIEEWEALKTLHQVSRLPQLNIPAPTITNIASQNSININNKQDHESIIVRSTPATISSGKRSGGTSVSCRGNAATISIRENGDQARSVKSAKRSKYS